MKKLVLIVAAFLGLSAGSASATCTGPAVMHDFPGTAFNMSLGTTPDGNCGSNVLITTWGGVTLGAASNYGTSPGAVEVMGVNAFVTNFPTTFPLNATPTLANGNGVVPTQGGAVLSATNGLYANILQGNAVNSLTNPFFMSPATSSVWPVSLASGAVSVGAGVDGWDLTEGTKEDAPCSLPATSTACSQIAVQKAIANNSTSTTTWGGSTLAAATAWGVAPSGNVIGVNADIMNANPNGQTTSANSSPVVIASDQSAVPVVGSVAAGAADSGNGVKVSCVYTTTPPTYTTGQRADCNTDSRGQLITVLRGFGSVNASVAASAASGSTTASGQIGLDTISFSQNWNGTAFTPSLGDSTAGTWVSPRANTTGGATYAHIAAGTATTVVKASAGTLYSITFNGAATASDVTTIYDNATGAGTVIAIPTTTGLTVPVPIDFGPVGLAFANGLTIITTLANGPDMTVVYK